jgi:hypothetical protein
MIVSSLELKLLVAPPFFGGLSGASLDRLIPMLVAAPTIALPRWQMVHGCHDADPRASTRYLRSLGMKLTHPEATRQVRV